MYRAPRVVPLIFCCLVAVVCGDVEAAPYDAVWESRDQGRWQRGLDQIDATAASDERQVLEGLLFAGAGRFDEAHAAADRLGDDAPPHLAHWIRAMAWIGVGSASRAYDALGAWPPIDAPGPAAYWNDVGLICELAGRPLEARRAYDAALRFVSGDAEGFAVGSVIADLPVVDVPVFIGAGDRWVAGSLFAHAARLTIECAQADVPERRDAVGALALAAWDVCIRRNVWPDHARAMRGRALYHLGRRSEAESALVDAHAALAAAGVRDADTSQVLGASLLTSGLAGMAVPYLRETVALDPDEANGWRLLGAALAVDGDHDAARDAFDRALHLEPSSSRAWLNRGLVGLEQGRWLDASSDLRMAGKLAPSDASVRANLDLANGELARVSGAAALMVAATRADSLALVLALPVAEVSASAP